MIRPTSDNRIRLSRQILNDAGFKPGNRISVVRDSNNSFVIVPTKTVQRNTNSVQYHVEQDGRARISNSVIESMGVRSRRKKPQVSVSEKKIRVQL